MSSEKMFGSVFAATAAALGIAAFVGLAKELPQDPSRSDASLYNTSLSDSFLFLSQSPSAAQSQSTLLSTKLSNCQTEVATGLGFPFPNKIEAHSAYNSYGGGNLQTPQIDFHTRTMVGSADPQTTISYSGPDGVSSYKIEWGKATDPAFIEPSPVDQTLSKADAIVEVIARDLSACVMR